MNIWIIDDDELYRFVITQTIATVAPELALKVFPDGEDAYDFIQQHCRDAALRPDIVLVDINMPRMDGWQFIQAMKELNSDWVKSIQMYMVSSSVSSEDMARAQNIPEIKDYLIKPLSINTIQTLLAS